MTAIAYSQEPKTDLRGFLPGTAGFALGVLHIASPLHYLPGNLQNATTLGFPVAFECVPDVDAADVFACSARLESGLQQAALRLEQRGVRAIIGACGSFAAFQSSIAARVNVPVFSSILTQVNFILDSLPPRRKLAIVFANQEAFSDRIRHECRVREVDRLVLTDCMSLPAFRSMLTEPFSPKTAELEAQLVEHIESFVAQHPETGAIMLQCSELPPYAAAIQRRVRLPIFDVVTLAEWIFGCVVRHGYAGYA
jgi:Asp/Glu/hydantoin racemase